MNVPLKLAGFAGVLGLAFGGAFAAGSVLDPTTAPPAEANSAAHGTDDAPSGPAGLAVSQDGFTLVPESTSVTVGSSAPFRFNLVGPDGSTVRGGYEIESERELHFVVVRRDTATFQHLHPTRDRDGTWSTPLALTDPGTYRAFADFTVGGQRRTLATDLFVAGEFQPEAWPAVTDECEVGGFTVALTAGELRVGEERGLTFQVARAGQAVADLQPYLGEKGHLVALREGDLAYLHAHPDSATAPAGEIRFLAEFPSAGRYRLFLEFSVGGAVHVAAWTVEVGR